MSTQADQIIAAVQAADGRHPDDTIAVTGIQVRSLDLRTVYTGRWHSRDRDVYQCPDGSLVAVEYNEGLTETQDSTPPEGEAYRVAAREVTTTEYVREEA